MNWHRNRRKRLFVNTLDLLLSDLKTHISLTISSSPAISSISRRGSRLEARRRMAAER